MAPPTVTMDKHHHNHVIGHHESRTASTKESINGIQSGVPFYRTTFFQLKVFICVVMTLSVFLVKEALLPMSSPECLDDKVINWLAPVNRVINDHNDTWGRFFKITAQIPLDFIFFGQLFLWIHKGRSSRFLVALLLFFGMRAVTMQLFQFARPEGFNWTDPGFPSIIVPYGDHNDFFFSGHVGFLVIMGAEFFKLGYRKLGVFTLAVIPYEAFILVAHRVHFIIDITTGLVFGHYCFIVVGYFSENIDKLFVKFWEKVAGVDEEEKPLLESGKLDVKK